MTIEKLKAALSFSAKVTVYSKGVISQKYRQRMMNWFTRQVGEGLPLGFIFKDSSGRAEITVENYPRKGPKLARTAHQYFLDLLELGSRDDNSTH